MLLHLALDLHFPKCTDLNCHLDVLWLLPADQTLVSAQGADPEVHCATAAQIAHLTSNASHP